MLRLKRRQVIQAAATTASFISIFLNSQTPLGPVNGQSSFVPSRSAKVERYPSSCTICGQGCPLLIEVVDEKTIRRVLHNKYPGYDKWFAACGRPRTLAEVWAHPDRIKTPMIRDGPRGSGVFKPVSWDDALDYMAANIKKHLSNPEQIVFFSHQGCESMILDEFGRALGTPNVTDHADTCFHGSAAGRWFLFGRFVGPSAVYPDYEHAQFVVLMGRNPYGGIVAAPWAKIKSAAAAKGVRIVVFDVRFSEICEIAEKYFIVKPGSDLAISLAILREIIANRLYDENYLNRYTNAAMLVYTDTLEPARVDAIKSGPRSGKLDYLVYDDEDKEYVLKTRAKRPKLDFEGRYMGRQVITVLRLLFERLKPYTFEWAEEKSGVKADEIRWVARSLGQYGSRAFIDPGYKSVRYVNEPMLHRVNAMINVLIGSWGVRGGVAWARRAQIPIPKPDGELKLEAVAKC